MEVIHLQQMSPIETIIWLQTRICSERVADSLCVPCFRKLFEEIILELTAVPCCFQVSLSKSLHHMKEFQIFLQLVRKDRMQILLPLFLGVYIVYSIWILHNPILDSLVVCSFLRSSTMVPKVVFINLLHALYRNALYTLALTFMIQLMYCISSEDTICRHVDFAHTELVK